MVVHSKRRIHTFLLMVFIILELSCIDQENSDSAVTSDVRLAKCDVCHSFPGSVLCKSDTLAILGKTMTTCSDCHNSSIVRDSSINNEDVIVYFDKMVERDLSRVPATGKNHNNTLVTLEYNRCDNCHSYPSGGRAHEIHVLYEGQQCFECHFNSMQSETKSGTGEDTTIYTQKERSVSENDKLPLLNNKYHANRYKDIVFRKKMEKPSPPVQSYKWNEIDKSCSNISCHSGFPGPSKERTLWLR